MNAISMQFFLCAITAEVITQSMVCRLKAAEITF